MSTLSESTALRLVAAIERLAGIMERTQTIAAPTAEHMPAEVASLIIGGPEALKALNKRRARRRTSPCKN